MLNATRAAVCSAGTFVIQADSAWQRLLQIERFWFAVTQENFVMRFYCLPYDCRFARAEFCRVAEDCQFLGN
jgi:hypothetical protein